MGNNMPNYKFSDPIFGENATFIGNTVATVSDQTILSDKYGWRKYCDERAEKMHRPKLSDKELIEEFIILNWAMETDEKEGTTNHYFADSDKGIFDIPPEITEAAIKVERYFKEQNITGWKFRGIQERNFSEE